MKNKRTELMLAVLFVLGISLFAGWAGDAYKGDEIFRWVFERLWPEIWKNSGVPDFHWWRLGLGTASLIIASCLVWTGAKRVEGLFELDVKIDQGKNEQSARMLIFIVSTISNGFSVSRNSAGEIILAMEGQPSDLELTGNLDQDIQAITDHFPSPFNWQQQLRGIREHLRFAERRLEKVVYVGSESGSYEQIPALQLLMEPYLAGVRQFERCGTEFLSYEKLRDDLRRILRQASAEGYRDSDIVIDITGGTKTASIAGADATLENHVRFQYVDTGGSEVFIYHIVGKGKRSA